jgi:small subunit ribosomal protein S7
MPRKGNVVKRDVLPDPIYNSKLVTKLINSIMYQGKKNLAQNILYGAFTRIRETTSREPLEVFNDALNNIMPMIEVRSRRIGGQNYQVPSEVRSDRRLTLGLRWLVQYSRSRNEKTMEERLAKEIVDASNSVGAAVKKKEDMHKMAEANKAFAHYRF